MPSSDRTNFFSLLKKAIGSPSVKAGQTKAPVKRDTYSARQTRPGTPGDAAEKQRCTSP